MSTLSGIDTQPLAVEHLDEVVDLHTQTFPEYFLTHLGSKMLKLFYGEFVDQSGNYGFVACSENRVVGFVAGTANSDALYAQFYRRHFLNLMGIFAVCLIKDAYIRKNIWDRTVHIRRAVKSLFVRDTTTSKPKNDDSDLTTDILARLLSIGVDSNFRGRGVADMLVRALCHRLAQDGIETVGLSVNADNARAIAFYKKNGWSIETANENTLRFWRAT